MAELFDWILGPVEIDVLVRMIAYLLDIKDQQIELLDDPSSTRWDLYFAANTQSSESYIEVNDLLARLWQTVIQLPVEQRDSFALGFEDHAGQDLFTVLLAAESSTGMNSLKGWAAPTKSRHCTESRYFSIAGPKCGLQSLWHR